MTGRVRKTIESIRESLWFVPALFTLAAIGGAFGLVQFDARADWDGEDYSPLLFGAGAEGARGMLSAIASSMITVAGLTFTLTLSALTQASSQYSPRVLRNFMRDRVNQRVMGYFVAAFTYCLLVLRTIRGTDENRFVPSLAVLVGLVLALGGVVALIVFIHHIAESLQLGTICRRVVDESTAAIGRLFPEKMGEPAPVPTAPLPGTGWQRVTAPTSGYVQDLAVDDLLDWAVRNEAVVRLERRVGEFVVKETPLLSWRAVERPTEKELDRLTGLLSIGKHRTISKDAGFGIQQLVDIALKALSAGVNDTSTALMAIDYLTVLLAMLARRAFPANERTDGERVRVLVQAESFEEYLTNAFDLIRVNAKGNHAVLIRLVMAFDSIAACALPERLPSLERQIDLTQEQAVKTLESAYEKRIVLDRIARWRAAWVLQRTADESAGTDSTPA
jgi:uncharacterized membrane protein